MDRRVLATAGVLFVAAAASTVAIGFGDPRAEYVYEWALFTLGAIWCRSRIRPLPGAFLAAILAWGFIQLALGGTVYRYATLQASLRSAALAATAWIGCAIFGSGVLRDPFLRAFAWFGVVIAVVSVLAYYTSPGKVLWIWNAPYPDIWGPFLSRNNFAQFLELAMPVALWLALREPDGSMLYALFAAIMLASGLASASRAGSLILLFETLTVLWLRRKSTLVRRMAPGIALATVLFAALAGIGNLAGRMTSPDPFQVRREIMHSTLKMISTRPFSGFGLGTFPSVYPEYAEFDSGQTVEHAHNDWLEWAAEGGIPYAALWLGLAMWVVRPALRNLWGIGVLGCFIHGLVDYPFARLGISAWIFLLIGMLGAERFRSQES